MLVFTVLIAGLAVIVANMQAVSDWWMLHSYTPDQRVVQLADETTMKSDTRRVFYINHPQLDDKSEFNGHCRTVEQTIVLGCFIDHDGIYLLNVTDPRLDGVVEVTAAHETLHAMYARLDDAERAKVDKMTASFFATLNNERIKKTIAGYRAKDPSVVPNELHSILGTEVRNLSPELENYYKQYFSDRTKIVDYSDKYEQVFTSIEVKAKSFDDRLTALKRTIDANEAEIESKTAALDNKQRELNGLRSAGNIDEYNRQVPVYNAMIRDYNGLINQTKLQIDEYNALLNQRNQLVIQQQQLHKSIDSNSINEKSSR